MKKTLATVAALLTALMVIGCASTEEAAPVVEEAAPAVEVVAEPEVVLSIEDTICGEWNEDKTEYVIDLTYIGDNDTQIEYWDDDTADVTFTGNYQSFMIPIPYSDPYFMENVKKVWINVSSDQTGVQKKFAWKLSDDQERAWAEGGGMLGQGDHCCAFMFRDYEEDWDETDIELYFNGDDFSFDPLNKVAKDSKAIGLDGVKALGFCNNTTATPFTFTINSIIFTTYEED